ncbi:MAG TPA: Ig-like domain-containing protein [Candidatus Acidoferrales bacterium]|nr:Ig-like domain-containing protein [Candidatus Acidoferrales bacterium]
MTITGRFGLSIAAAGAALALSASAAGATARFASPTGTSVAPCTQVAPCDIVTAIKGSATNDDITIEPGTYSVSMVLYDEKKILTIHGLGGQPRPVIISSVNPAIALGGFGTSLSYVELDFAGSPAQGIIAFGGSNSIDRVISHGLASSDEPCVLEFTTTLTNSVCVADAPKSVALKLRGNGSMTARNDTLEAPGGEGAAGGIAVQASAFNGNKVTASLSNAIAHGANVDLMAQTDGIAGSEAAIVADHSNYKTEAKKSEGGTVASVTPPGTGTNQTTAPAFVNAGNDDFHELTGSPTIGAGFNSPLNGTLDLDGNPRQFGGTADMGAYQFIPGPTCQAVIATTPFGQAVSVQLQCTDALGEPVTSYAIVAAPAHGTAGVNAAAGALTYTPAAGYSGPDGFTFDATSSHGTGVPATGTITVGAPPPSGGAAAAAPADSQPVISPTTFAGLTRGASVIARAAKGTTISYTDTQAAKTSFLVRQALGKGVLSRGKCLKPPLKGHAHGRSCTRFKSLGSFSHADAAGANRFRFSGRVAGHTLKPGSYQLLSAPTNASGKTGATHANNFKIVSH